MQYITHRRFKGAAICGYVNLPTGTECEEREGYLYWQGRALCAATSETAHGYFARNDDGRGIRRGRLTRAITNRLAQGGAEHQARWDKIWASPLCQPLKRAEHADHWLWNDDFYRAGIATLESIAAMIGAREEA